MKKLILSIVMLAITLISQAQQTNRERAIAFYIAINKNDAAALEQLISPNFEVYIAPQKQTYKGLEFYRFVYETHQRVKGFRQDIKDIFGEYSWMCVTGVVVGTNRKPSKRTEVEFTSVLEFDSDGRIKLQTIHDNRAIIAQQHTRLVKN